MADQDLAPPEPALQPEDVRLLKLLPHTVTRVPMKWALVDAATLLLLARIEALRTRGLLTAVRAFPGGGVFSVTAMLTRAGAEAVARCRR
jgi:hypothetical protein